MVSVKDVKVIGFVIRSLLFVHKQIGFVLLDIRAGSHINNLSTLLMTQSAHVAVLYG